jgi:hypothetical protein
MILCFDILLIRRGLFLQSLSQLLSKLPRNSNKLEASEKTNRLFLMSA